MKFFYATYLVSFYFYLSLVTASPVRPGSTTLSPVAESQARAFNAPRARNVTSEAVPVPLSTGAAETGTEEQASSEATPTQASAALSEGQATPEISATATETQDASETQAASEAQTTSESQTSETQTPSETSVSVTDMTSAAPEMTGTATENQAASQMTAAATESQAAPEMTSAASGMASQSEASPTQAEASPQETMGSSPSPSPSVSEDASNSEAHRVHKASPKQGNLCKTGDSYCCDEKDGSMSSIHPVSTIHSSMLTSMFS
ncbi:serine-threonine rich protein, putative [Trichophyton verrucosum HKI 0517]|uniref:Serine-threonine rich protein, putative n=1 Tax=Trichophyton verrucosum (strain HKI 0517) TaxID=663202 RepID=D4CZ56_TRIVH|nr:serine-threonine rich protein, putative [Trichophyton verrucosum HKI 0517]EFE45111.1 serine-threonine rich protein, putative [Trichophyton verrucosum HKI 0517]